MQGKNRYIITILGRKLTARQIAGVTRIVADQDMNIDDIKRLTGRIPLDENARTPKASVEFSVRGTPRDKEQMKADFMKLSAEQEMDISFQEESMYRRMRRLICFDMDSTLIETEVIDERFFLPKTRKKSSVLGEHVSCLFVKKIYIVWHIAFNTFILFTKFIY